MYQTLEGSFSAVLKPILHMISQIAGCFKIYKIAHFCRVGIQSGNHEKRLFKASPGRETIHLQKDSHRMKNVQIVLFSVCASENCTDSKDEISARMGNR